MERRHATYRPASRWRRGRVSVFRSVQLNLAGWAAVVALCLAGAGVGHTVSRLVGASVGLGLAAGAGVVATVLVVLDRRRWARLNKAPLNRGP